MITKKFRSKTKKKSLNNREIFLIKVIAYLTLMPISLKIYLKQFLEGNTKLFFLFLKIETTSSLLIKNLCNQKGFINLKTDMKKKI